MRRNFGFVTLSIALVACGLGDTGPIGTAPDTSYTMPDGHPWLPPPGLIDATGDSGSGLILSAKTLDPDRGPVAGLQQVQITGSGFIEGTRVFFGGIESPEVFVQGFTQLTAVTPPHPRGIVDVRVERPSGQFAELKEAFTYESEIAIESLEPAFGPITGGNAVTLYGSGFTATTQVLVGDRLSPKVEFIDEFTLAFVTPAGNLGPADVFVSDQGQSGREKDGYRYVAEPRILHIDPAYGPLEGGTLVEIVGTHMDSEGLQLLFADDQALLLSNDGSTLKAHSPPAEEVGAVSVRIQNTNGGHAIPQGFVYMDESATTPEIVGVVPATGSTSGGAEVVVVLQGISLNETPEVRFGEQSAEVLSVSSDGYSVQVVTPESPAGPGIVDVSVETASEDPILKPAAFTYVDDLHLAEVSPGTGPQSGGTEVILTGSGFSEDTEVIFGVLPAIEVSIVSPSEIHAITPQGAPGVVDIRMVDGTRTAILPESFEYLSSGLQVFLLHPTRGARAGGTYFRIVGAGYEADTRVFIGDREALVQIKGSQLITGYSPRGVPGLADIRIQSDVETLTLPKAWLYFDPAAYLPGTWGNEIDEAVNVTVIEANTGDRVMGAFVTLGADPATPFQGVTDLNGQITLSGPGLDGPTTVTAGKQMYTAFSIAHFDAENATIMLVRLNPPSPPGPPPPGTPLLPGAVEGEVYGLGKYVVVPPGECDEEIIDPVTGVSICAECIEDSDCGNGVCVQNSDGTSYCSQTCLSDDNCPEDFVCANLGWTESRCVPEPGVKEIRCYVAPQSVFSPEPEFVEGSTLEEEGIFTFDSRLGDVAIVCLGGVVDEETGEFTPLTMGVQRHAYVMPQMTTQDLNIQLNIPLKGQMRIRLGNPLDPEIFTSRRISAFLDLGSDGVVPIGKIEALDEHGEEFRLSQLPTALGSDLEDAKLAFYVDLTTSPAHPLPSAEVLINDVDSLNLIHGNMIRLVEDGSYESQSIGQSPNINGIASSGVQTFAVGEEGAILYWNGSHLALQSSPTNNTLHGIAARPEGGFVAVGEKNTLIEFDGISWSTTYVKQEVDLFGVCANDTDIYVAGAATILKRENGEWVEDAFGLSHTYHGIAILPDGRVRAVGENGSVLFRSAESETVDSWVEENLPLAENLYAVDAFLDRFAAVGSKGTVALHTEDSGWSVLPAPTYDTLHAVRILTAERIVVGGPLGSLYLWDGTEWETLTDEETFVGVRGLHGPRDSKPELVLGHHEVYLGPLLDPPVMERPTMTFPFGHPPVLRWDVPDAPSEALNFLRLMDGSGFPMWTIVSAQTEGIDLPDLELMAGIQVLMPGIASHRFIRALAPNFNINSFSSKNLSLFKYRSWTTISENFNTD